MLSNVKEAIGNAFCLFAVSRKREEYREKLKDAIDAVELYLSDSVTEYTLLEELHNAAEKLEERLERFLNGSERGRKRAKVFVAAWLFTLCATLCDRRLGIVFDIM